MVAGESRERALDLVRRMEKSPRFREPQIVAEATEQQPQNPGDRVQFQISTLYGGEPTAGSAQPGPAPKTETSGSPARGGF